MLTVCVGGPERGSGTLLLGRAGEHLAREIVFDCSDFLRRYGEGSAQLLHQRRGDSVPYLATIHSQGQELHWPVTDDDTARPGYGRAELRWYVGETLVKSRMFRTVVRPALGQPENLSPEEKSELELLAQRVQSAEQFVWGEAAAQATTLEPGSAATASCVNGVFSFGIPKGATGEQGPQGPKGDAGASPVRGVDYWTAADVESVTNAAIAAALAAYPVRDETSY